MARYIPNKPNIKLGKITAIIGGKPPLRAKTLANWIKRMYTKLSKIPKPRGSPTPPLTFRDDNATPIKVST